MAFNGISDKIAEAFKAGDSAGLAAYFKANVDLSILEEDDLYSKANAEKKLATFFQNHPVSSFSILHEGQSNNGLQYTIGSLETSNGTFRVSFYVKEENGQAFIQQIMIDEE